MPWEILESITHTIDKMHSTQVIMHAESAKCNRRLEAKYFGMTKNSFVEGVNEK